MANNETQPFTVYLDRVMQHLEALAPEERSAIADELQAHLEDAAAEREQPAADPALQAEVVKQLGSSGQLGRSLALAHGVHLPGWRFWLLWVLAGIGGWLMVFPMYMVSLPVAGALTACLHTLLLQRHMPQDDWWKWGMVTNVGGWLLGTALIGVFLFSPLSRLPEDQAEGILGLLIIGTSGIVGITQWLAIRGHVRYAWAWIIMPCLALMVSFRPSHDLFWSIVATPGRLNLALFTSSIVQGALYGAVTGMVMVALLRSSSRGYVRWPRAE